MIEEGEEEEDVTDYVLIVRPSATDALTKLLPKQINRWRRHACH